MNNIYKNFLMVSALALSGASLMPTYAATCSQDDIASAISLFPASGVSVEDFQHNVDGYVNDLNTSISQYQGCLLKAVTGAKTPVQQSSQIVPKQTKPQSKSASALTAPGNFLDPAKPKTKKEPSTIINWFN